MSAAASRLRWPATLAILLAFFPWVGAKNYDVRRVHIQATVRSDGGVEVEETLVFSFRGSYKYAYRDIPLTAGQNVSRVAVAEKGTAYREDSSAAAGTYSVTRKARGVQVRWNYRARNEEREFRFSYWLTGAVTRHDDVAELYMKFVGDAWDRPMGRVVVDLHLPEGNTAPVEAWAHGPLFGDVQILSNSHVQFKVAPLPANTFWEGRVLFAPSAVGALSPAGDGDRADDIRAQEAQWALEANRMRDAARARARRSAERQVWQGQWASRLWPLCLLLGLAALVVWLMLWRQYGRPHRVASIAVPGEVPSPHPPALVARLLTGTVGTRALVATLLDLARRGHYRISEKRETRQGWFGHTRIETDYLFETTGEKIDLLELEEDLVAFVHGLVGRRKAFRMSELKKAAKGQTRKLRRWFEKWRRHIGRLARKEGLLEPVPVRPMILNALCGVLVAAAGGVVCLVTRSPAGVPAIAGGLLQALGTAALTRRTPQGRRLYLAWKAFMAHIKKISRSLGPVSLTSGEWERYLIYAVIFNLHTPLGKVMERSLHGSSTGFFPWFVGAHSGSGAAGVSGLSVGITSMVGAISSTMSSATGGGGGASVGGGGGAGGGGGGAG
ncbi:MAG: DUF2207 domain-containing protein [Acidobacteria bacterium]|nr:DUF2207 domain-containing protein [Acidobacteriota bacterium]